MKIPEELNNLHTLSVVQVNVSLRDIISELE